MKGQHKTYSQNEKKSLRIRIVHNKLMSLLPLKKKKTLITT